MGVTLGEEVMLLSLDDRSGAAHSKASAAWGVAGGGLLELVLAGRVRIHGDRLQIADATPTGEPLLDGQRAELTAWLSGNSKGKATDWLAKAHQSVYGPTLDRLCRRGLVAEQKQKVLRIFPGPSTYPEVDGSVERELRARLSRVVLNGEVPDERTAGLIALLHAAKLHGLAFPGHPPQTVQGRMAEIANGQWAAESVRKAMDDMQAALAAVAAATTVVTTTVVLS